MNAVPRARVWRGDALARSTARSHVGRVRRINEDRVFDWPDGGVWAVIDGMGGHRGGDVAAQTVVEALRGLQAGADSVLAALADANARIHARNAAEGEQAGATVVALGLGDGRATIAWAGDSRCYRWRDGALELLTRDHSVVQELVDAGLLTADGAARHPQANVITRALGVDATCDVETRVADYRAGDRFLLCSDGLSRSLVGGDVTNAPIEALADDLLARALANDGSDNISLVLVDPGG